MNISYPLLNEDNEIDETNIMINIFDSNIANKIYLFIAQGWYMKDEKLLHQWQTLIHEIMGDPEVPDVNKKHIDNIKKNLATEMSMKEAIKEIKNID